MKFSKAISVIGCVLGAGMVGFFANQLTTSVFGAVMYALGVFLMVISMGKIFKNGGKNQ